MVKPKFREGQKVLCISAAHPGKVEIIEVWNDKYDQCHYNCKFLIKNSDYEFDSIWISESHLLPLGALTAYVYGD